MHVDTAALRALEREKGIPFDVVARAIEDAIYVAYSTTPDAAPRARVKLDRATGVITIWARTFDEEGTPQDIDVTPSDIGKAAAMAARSVILQRMREAEDDVMFGEFSAREGDLITGTVVGAPDPVRGVMFDLGKVEGVLPPVEQVPGEYFRHGERARLLVLGVRRGPKGLVITLSRSHPNLIKQLFAREAPEVDSGLVAIRAISREAGVRTKMAVQSTREGVNAKGACIGEMGGRVRAVVAELRGEKIDIVDWSDDPATLVANALSPASTISVEVVDEATRSARVVVPHDQLSLAIGRDGHNARLAARLTGWRIDIRDSQDPDAPLAPGDHSATARPVRPPYTPQRPTGGPRGGFRPQGDRPRGDGGPRQGGFGDRPPREGGFGGRPPRDRAFGERGPRDGYGDRGSRPGGGGFEGRGRRDGGFGGRGSYDGGARRGPYDGGAGRGPDDGSAARGPYDGSAGRPSRPPQGDRRPPQDGGEGTGSRPQGEQE